MGERGLSGHNSLQAKAHPSQEKGTGGGMLGGAVSGGEGTYLVVQHEEQRTTYTQVPWPLHLEPIRLLSGGCPVPLSRGRS